MTKVIQLSDEVYASLYELKFDFRVQTFDDVVRVLLAKEGLEEYEGIEEE